MSDLPDFIPQVPAAAPHDAFDPQLPPPYMFNGVDLRVFPILADKGKLQKICDRFINDVSAPLKLPFEIKPLQSLVLLEVLNYPKMSSTYPGQPKLGFSSQRESFFAIPVVKTDLGGLPIGVGLFTPFIFVDNDWSLISGRDVVGFPKVYGKIEMPNEIAGQDSGFQAVVQIRVLEPFSNASQSSLKTLIEFGPAIVPFAAASQPAADASAPRLTELSPETVWPFGPLEFLYGQRASELGLEPVEDAVYQLLLENVGIDVGVSNFTFKQMRDAEDPGKAAYQEILECEISMHAFGALTSLSDMQLKIHEFASLNVGNLLGVSSNGISISPLLQFGHSADLSFAVKKSIYKRCGATVSMPPDKSCVDIFGEGCRLAKSTAKKQINVVGHIAETMASGKLHPSHYVDDIRTATTNIADYSAGVWDLAMDGLGYLFRRGT